MFNLGLGWVFVTSEADAEAVRRLTPTRCWSGG